MINKYDLISILLIDYEKQYHDVLRRRISNMNSLAFNNLIKSLHMKEIRPGYYISY